MISWMISWMIRYEEIPGFPTLSKDVSGHWFPFCSAPSSPGLVQQLPSYRWLADPWLANPRSYEVTTPGLSWIMSMNLNMFHWLVVKQPSWKIWVRQWEGWHPIYEMEHKKGVKPPASLNLYNGPSSFSLMNIAFCQVDRVDSIFQTYPHHSPEFLARTLEGHLHHGKDIFSLLAGRHLEVSIVMVVPLNIAGWFISTSQSKMDENWGYLHFGNPPHFCYKVVPTPQL